MTVMSQQDLAEFQSGDTVGLTHGGLGVSLSIGSAGQVLKVNSGASALEFGNVEAIVNIDGATDLTSATLATTDLILIIRWWYRRSSYTCTIRYFIFWYI